jgi:hypothetical protein
MKPLCVKSLVFHEQMTGADWRQAQAERLLSTIVPHTRRILA